MAPGSFPPGVTAASGCQSPWGTTQPGRWNARAGALRARRAQRLDRHRGIMALLAFCVTFWPVGCDELPEGKPFGVSTQPGLERRRQPGIIALVAAGRDDPLWPVLQASAKRYDRELCDRTVQYLVPEGNAPQDQIDLLRSLTDPNIVGLCVHLTNADALGPTLQRVHTDGRLVVSIGQPAPPELRAGHVGFQETAVGEALARATLDAVPDQGTVMLLHAGAEHPVYAERWRGFADIMRRNPRVAVLAELNCDGDPREARAMIRDRSARYPRLSAWVALADWPLRGLRLIDEAMPKGFQLITFGGLPDQWRLLRDGSSPALVAANYSSMGGLALQLCEVMIGNPERDKEVYTVDLRTVLPTNLDAYIEDWNAWTRLGDPPDAKPNPAQAGPARNDPWFADW